MENQETPMGVLILATLQTIQALVLLLPGALLLIIPIVGWIIGIPMVVVGIFLLFIAWGLVTMQSWAWFWAFIMNCFGLIVSLLNWSPLGIGLSLLIVLYLNQSSIRDRFR